MDLLEALDMCRESKIYVVSHKIRGHGNSKMNRLVDISVRHHLRKLIYRKK